MQTMYYAAGIDANFFELKDALYAAAEEANRIYESVSVLVDTGNQAPYVYCVISYGEMA